MNKKAQKLFLFADAVYLCFVFLLPVGFNEALSSASRASECESKSAAGRRRAKDRDLCSEWDFPAFVCPELELGAALISFFVSNEDLSGCGENRVGLCFLVRDWVRESFRFYCISRPEISWSSYLEL